MTNGTALSRVRESGALDTLSLPQLLELGEVLSKTGFLPAAIKTKEQVAAIVLKGRELGIPTMYALSNIAVIQGKPAANAELMLALIYRDHGDDAVRFVEATSQKATISYKRRGWRERQTFTFSGEDARAAGLTDGNWKKYPGAMLRARCISAVARLAFPDTIGGMYTPDELGGDVDPETGEIGCVVDAAPAPTSPAAARVPEVLAPEDRHWRDTVDRYQAAHDRLTEVGVTIKWPRTPSRDLSTADEIAEAASRMEQHYRDHFAAADDAPVAADADAETPEPATT